MEPVFACIREGDKLYVVYTDLNDCYQIGEAVVTGFINWSYTVGDRWEDYGEKPMTNINYKLNGINFSRSLEYSLNKTHFTDSPEYNEKYDHILGDRYVETFTNYNEAKEHIIFKLNKFIQANAKQIEKLENEQKKYNENLAKIISE